MSGPFVFEAALFPPVGNPICCGHDDTIRGSDDTLMSDSDKRGGDGPNIGVVTKTRPKTRKPAL
jgi:hypothetical protein